MTRILGLDIGDKKIGLAFAELDTHVAIPRGVLDKGSRDDKIAAIAEMINSEEIDLVVAGMPYNLKGEIAHQAEKVQNFIKHLEKAISVPVEIIDERMTSRMAGGGNDDAIAAMLILQTYLDIKRIKSGDEDNI